MIVEIAIKYYVLSLISQTSWISVEAFETMPCIDFHGLSYVYVDANHRNCTKRVKFAPQILRNVIWVLFFNNITNNPSTRSHMYVNRSRTYLSKFLSLSHKSFEMFTSLAGSFKRHRIFVHHENHSSTSSLKSIVSSLSKYIVITTQVTQYSLHRHVTVWCTVKVY